jgi:hypothetical protein
MHVSSKIKTQPAVEPVILEELKIFARVDTDVENDLLENLIVTAREFAEKYTNRAFITQTWEMAFDFWAQDVICGVCCVSDCYLKAHCPDFSEYRFVCEHNRIELDKPPLQSITQVRMLDNDGNSAVVSSSSYITDVRAEPGVISAITVPSGTRDMKAIEIEYVAGYGDARADVPQGIKTAIMAWAAEIYESRIPNSEPSENIANMLHPYKIFYL